MHIIIINGPNLNRRTFLWPGAGGSVDYAGLVTVVNELCVRVGISVEFFQSNHEGDLIDEVQNARDRAEAIILNPGGYAYTSVALLDALRVAGVPAAEVVTENGCENEPFRRTDLVAYGCQARFKGPDGYLEAALFLERLQRAGGSAGSHIAN